MRSARLCNGRHRVLTSFQGNFAKKPYAYSYIYIYISMPRDSSFYELREIIQDDYTRIKIYRCLYKDKDYSSDSCLVEKMVRLSGKRIISSWRGFKADSNGRSIMLIKEREKVVEVDNVWVMNRGSPVRGNPTCSIIDYRVYCTISRLDGEIYTLEHTRASQVGGHATRIAELVRREFSIKFPVSRGETEIRGTLVPRLIAD